MEPQPPVSIIASEAWDRFAVELRSDGLVQVIVKTEKEVGVDEVKKIHVATGKITGGKKAPLLVLSEEYALPTVEARNYMADPGNPYSSAEAYIVRSLPQKIVGNFFLQFHKPLRPMQIFTGQEEAIAWLKGFTG